MSLQDLLTEAKVKNSSGGSIYGTPGPCEPTMNNNSLGERPWKKGVTLPSSKKDWPSHFGKTPAEKKRGNDELQKRGKEERRLLNLRKKKGRGLAESAGLTW